MRKRAMIALMLVLLPAMSWAGDHNINCGCGSGGGTMMTSTCGSTCGSSCGTCCKQHTCTSGCNSCNSCAPACTQPCACMAWEPYCGCAMLNSLCISMEAACNDGTAGPLKLLLRDNNYDDIVTIELAGPIDGYYTMNYTFDAPIRADSVREAVLMNDTDDPVTLTWLQVWGNFGECYGGWTYIDHTCPGVVIGPGGCPRMVLF
jgi:hypothetical protein